MREKSPLPRGTVASADSRTSRTKHQDTSSRHRHHVPGDPGLQEHPVRGDPLFIPGILAMVFGLSLALAGVAYNAAVDTGGSRSLGVCLLGIGVFLLVLGELFCLLICFLRRKQVAKWNRTHCQPLIERDKKASRDSGHKTGKGKSRERPGNSGEKTYQGKIKKISLICSGICQVSTQYEFNWVLKIKNGGVGLCST